MSEPYKRKDSPYWWISWMDPRKKPARQQASSGTTDLQRAKEIMAEIERRVASEVKLLGAKLELTVDGYRQQWEARQKGRGVLEAKRESARLANHGGALLQKPLREVRRVDVLAWMDDLRAGGKFAPRTIRHAYSALRSMFSDALAHEEIMSNPCSLEAKKNELPPKIDKNPSWRRTAVFTRAEVVRLITDRRIKPWRRTLNGLIFLGGMRIGEALARRWLEIDTARPALACLHIATSYSTIRRAEGSTKTEVVREMPIHPVLDALLASWALVGWEDLVGRPPGLGDLIVPSRRGGHKDANWCQHRLLLDCDLLRIRRRRQHDGRRTLVSLAREDGANAEILKIATHGPSGDVIDIYTTLAWPVLCAEVAKLRLPLLEGGAGLAATDLLRSEKPMQNQALTTMPRRGLEPPWVVNRSPQESSPQSGDSRTVQARQALLEPRRSNVARAKRPRIRTLADLAEAQLAAAGVA